MKKLLSFRMSAYKNTLNLYAYEYYVEGNQ